MVDDRAHLAELLGSGVERLEEIGTSHSWRLYRARLSDGREVFVKAAHDQAQVFAAEAAGLRWLAANDGVHTAAGMVAEVLGVDGRFLVLPWIAGEPPTPAAAERFGRELAALHAEGAQTYGAPWEGRIADLPLDNTEGREWPGWYAERRLAPFLSLGARSLDAQDVRLIERVIEDIDQLAGPAEPPSRIHGDLWSGNVMWSGGRGVLIDPAAHGGHRETDLAMLSLFGSYGLDQILGAYDEVAPLSAGWRERVPLHQLHPLLVHVALFGRSYRGAAVEAARKTLRAGT